MVDYLDAQFDGANRIEFLRSVPLFERLRQDELSFLAQHARCERVARGTVLFRQSMPANEFWLIRRGGVKLVQRQPFALPFAVRVIGPRGPVGLDVVVQQAAYSVTAETLCWSHLIVWSRDVIRRVMHSNAHLAVSAMQVLSNRIEDFRARYRELANERAETRVARVLFRAYCDWTAPGHLDHGNGGGGNGGAHPVDVPFSRRDLADIAGTTLYTVSRLIQDWERQGILRGGRMRVTMLQPTSLPLAAARTVKVSAQRSQSIAT